MVPFALALAVCVGMWIWLTVLRPTPWEVQLNENHFRYLFMRADRELSPRGRARSGALPGHSLVAACDIAIDDAAMASRGDGRAGIFASALVLMWLDNRMPVTPEYSCFGGWHNVLILRGDPNRFSWDGTAPGNMCS